MAGGGGQGDPPYVPPTEIIMDVGDTEPATKLHDSVGLLLEQVVDIDQVPLDSVVTGDPVRVLADRLRNLTEIPADPFYDDDGNPATPEMMAKYGPAFYLTSVGKLLYVGEGHGTIEEWQALTLEEKCDWVESYLAP